MVRNRFRIFTVALLACVFILARNVHAFTSSDYYSNQNINVGLESMASRTQLNITFNGDYTLNGVIYESGTSYILKVSGAKIDLNGVLYDNISFIPKNASNTIKIVSSYSRSYLGVMTFKTIPSNKISKISNILPIYTLVIPVNTVYIEDYLKGVVGLEMSDYFPIEALKAQAVAARNYALANVSKHINKTGYSICDTIDCQVYGGYEKPLIYVNLNVNAAVDSTKGKVLLSGGNLITAFYSASDGGYTEDSGNVWTNSLSYLKAKQDSYDGYDVNYLWKKTFTNEEINSLFKMSLKVQPTDTFVKIDTNTITKFDSGRIKNISLIFKNSVGTQYILNYSKEAARTFLNLKSALYNVVYYPATSTTTETYSFDGKGIGHGVGMSQIGARNRATAGQSFEDILKFYYDGTTLLNVVITNSTVTFNSQGGSVASSKITNNYSAITAPAAPTKTGYTFGGWYKEAGCLNAWNFTTDKVTTNTILYAKWTINKYFVTLNSQGGNVISNINVNYNSAIITPAAPTKTGYTFGGWYKETGCLNLWNFTTDKVTTNTTLYAKWTINKYTVTLNSQGGNLISNISANYNSVIIAPGAPTKTGYTFSGWYKEVGYLNAWNFATDKVIANTTLHAKWITAATQLPTNLKAIASSYNNINVSWSSVTGVSGYEVYRSTSSSGTYTLISTTAQASYNNTALATNTTYYYKVKAYKLVVATKVYSGFSSVVNAKPILTTPISYKVTSYSYNSTNTSWGIVNGASAYEVYRATASAGPYTLISTTSQASYNYTGLTTNSTYYYKVRAYRMVGTVKVYSGYSTTISLKSIPSMPGSLKAISSSYNSINISWSAVNGATGYEVYRSIASNGAYTLVTTTTSTSYNNTGLTTNMTYYYKVRAYRMVGTVKVYSYFLTIVNSKPIPSVPISVKATRISSKSIQLAWSSVSGANGYEVYRADSSSGTYSLLTKPTSLNYTNSGLITGKTYYYKMRTYRIVGTLRVYSNWSVLVYVKP
ncbi:SpoIID/LytB domain-containing protein [Clostridium lacusfryxellense]|uniref:SpoIID/LytB domain-containing protein n=1 Tax=Clostridium lacusfryxellense TaxID=205328 RepID=UPI001C0B41E9|nr:SpoIID/LytB domain-containing protein [Clostridium lacusfryxellense]MBU3111035.1 SpoIID/LytB domain-containing protein [Clostridium lacusfryxellense]